MYRLAEIYLSSNNCWSYELWQYQLSSFEYEVPYISVKIVTWWFRLIGVVLGWAVRPIFNPEDSLPVTFVCLLPYASVVSWVFAENDSPVWKLKFTFPPDFIAWSISWAWRDASFRSIVSAELWFVVLENVVPHWLVLLSEYDFFK